MDELLMTSMGGAKLGTLVSTLSCKGERCWSIKKQTHYEYASIINHNFTNPLTIMKKKFKCSF
jgi:hypothetical protein